MRFVALIPAYNEEEQIERTVLSALGIPDVERVIVIDDGSSDTTASRASDAGATVVSQTTNQGKGAALDAGLARAGEFDGLLLLDGDLGDSASEAQLLIDQISSGVADMAIARFPPPSRPGGFGVVKGLARQGISMMGSGFEPQAPLSGQRALTREAADAVAPFAFGYGVEVAMTVRALRAGLRIVEVPTQMSHAETGRDAAGFAHRGRQFVHVARALLRLSIEKR